MLNLIVQLEILFLPPKTIEELILLCFWIVCVWVQQAARSGEAFFNLKHWSVRRLTNWEIRQRLFNAQWTCSRLGSFLLQKKKTFFLSLLTWNAAFRKKRAKLLHLSKERLRCTGQGAQHPKNNRRVWLDPTIHPRDHPLWGVSCFTHGVWFTCWAVFKQRAQLMACYPRQLTRQNQLYRNNQKSSEKGGLLCINQQT